MDNKDSLKTKSYYYFVTFTNFINKNILLLLLPLLLLFSNLKQAKRRIN